MNLLSKSRKLVQLAQKKIQIYKKLDGILEGEAKELFNEIREIEREMNSCLK